MLFRFGGLRGAQNGHKRPTQKTPKPKKQRCKSLPNKHVTDILRHVQNICEKRKSHLTAVQYQNGAPVRPQRQGGEADPVAEMRTLVRDAEVRGGLLQAWPKYIRRKVS